MNKLKKLWHNLRRSNLEIIIKYNIRYKTTETTWSTLNPASLSMVVTPEEEVDILELISLGSSTINHQYEYIGNGVTISFKSLSVKRTNKQKK